MFVYLKDLEGKFVNTEKLAYFKNSELEFYNDTDISKFKNVTDLISKQEKVIVRFPPQFFHVLFTTLAIILIYYKRNPDTLFVINPVREDLNLNETSYFRYFFNLLKRKNINYIIAEASEDKPLKINNFRFFPFYPLNKDAIEALVEVSLEHTDTVNPMRKVYLSRKKVEILKNNEHLFQGEDISNFSYADDERIDNEEILIEYFSDLGFEIVCPEDFENMEEQIRFFSQTKTLVSVTTAGLSNAIFMKPQTKIIEFSIPLISGGVESIHDLYHSISFVKGQNYLSIPNRKSAQGIIDIIDGNLSMKEFICS
jgi:hypothetical protein